MRTPDINISDPRLQAAINAAVVFAKPTLAAARRSDDVLSRHVYPRCLGDVPEWAALPAPVLEVLAVILERADGYGSYPEEFFNYRCDENLIGVAVAIHAAGAVLAPLNSTVDAEQADIDYHHYLLTRLLITASAIDPVILDGCAYEFPHLARALTRMPAPLRPGTVAFALALQETYDTLRATA